MLILEQNRQAAMDMIVGDLYIPKGTNIYFPRLAIHHDPKLWGTNVHEFNSSQNDLLMVSLKQANTH
jgi:cytochrome P450